MRPPQTTAALAVPWQTNVWACRERCVRGDGLRASNHLCAWLHPEEVTTTSNIAHLSISLGRLPSSCVLRRCGEADHCAEAEEHRTWRAYSRHIVNVANRNARIVAQVRLGTVRNPPPPPFRSTSFMDVVFFQTALQTYNTCGMGEMYFNLRPFRLSLHADVPTVQKAHIDLPAQGRRPPT